MKHLFVSYDIALMAKEKGFNEECIASQVLHGSPNLLGHRTIINSDTIDNMLKNIEYCSTYMNFIYVSGMPLSEVQLEELQLEELHSLGYKVETCNWFQRIFEKRTNKISW